jgi:hypothetical protein
MGECRYRRTSMINGSPLLAVCGHLIGMLHLRRQWAYVLFVEGDILGRRWTRHQAAAASVVADPIVIDDGDVVNVDVLDNCRIDVSDGSVVVEVIVVPIATLIT